MRKYQKIQIICPGNAMTAGPEALHQLVAELNAMGQDATIVYHPFHKTFACPAAYRKYQTPVDKLADTAGNLIIYPEIFTQLALQTRHAQAAIWWMSVNNFTCVRYQNPLRDKIRYWKNVLKGRIPWQGIKALKNLQHYAQSHYAYDFLNNHQIKALLLSDPIPVYTDPDYLSALSPKLANAKRQDLICYNPSKGAAITQDLIAAFPDWRFQALQGYDREQLAEIFLSAKVYIDFGHHPGKDRLPREAAIHGCCVITGLYGSAANALDAPIPSRFKLDINHPQFPEQFAACIAEIFNQFDKCAQELDAYRDVIRQEPAVFRQQIAAAFLTEPSSAD